MPHFYSRYFTQSQKPQKLLIFLHGYNNTLLEMKPFLETLSNTVQGLVVAAPQGKSHSDKEPNRKSWYKISGFDAGGRRLKEETSVEEIADIYNQAAPILSVTAREMNAYIDDVQKKYGLDDEHTYIAGFSQGAMLAIWTALIRKCNLAGCFALSGLAAAHQALDSQLASSPKVYLFHGLKDKQVLFKCLPYTKQWLENKKIPVYVQILENTGHEICPQELAFMANIMNQPLF